MLKKRGGRSLPLCQLASCFDAADVIIKVKSRAVNQRQPYHPIKGAENAAGQRGELGARPMLPFTDIGAARIGIGEPRPHAVQFSPVALARAGLGGGCLAVGMNADPPCPFSTNFSRRLPGS